VEQNEQKGSTSYFCNSYYEGDYLKNQKHGHGTYVYSDGSSYSGEWLFGLWHGNGILRYSNGNIYSGDFVEGKKEGKGSLRINDENVFVTGEWISDRYQDPGTGATLNYYDENIYKYEGSWYYNDNSNWMASFLDRFSHCSIPFTK
jgi:hypothetical protein